MLFRSPVGTHLRVRIDPYDILLSRAQPESVSANNVLAATITGIRSDSTGPYADVQLALGEHRLLARITRYSLERLALRQGEKVFAVIKSVTVGGRDSALRTN